MGGGVWQGARGKWVNTVGSAGLVPAVEWRVRDASRFLGLSCDEVGRGLQERGAAGSETVRMALVWVLVEMVAGGASRWVGRLMMQRPKWACRDRPVVRGWLGVGIRMPG